MKALLILFLLPLAGLQRRLAALARVWAFCQLQARLKQRLDRSVVVLGCPEIHGTANIFLSSGLLLYRHTYLETQQQGKIEIGANVVLSRGVHIVAFDAIRIGEGSMIGEFTSIRDANHRFGGTNCLRNAGHCARPIAIGREVWIGRGVTLLPGVQVGDHAVIGANAVVTHDVAAGSVVAGIPARCLPLSNTQARAAFRQQELAS